MDHQAWMQAAKWLFEQKIEVFPLEIMEDSSNNTENKKDPENVGYIGTLKSGERVNCGWLAGSAAAMRSG